MSEGLSAREQILRHIELVDATTEVCGPPPKEWQRLRERFEVFDAAVQQMQESTEHGTKETT